MKDKYTVSSLLVLLALVIFLLAGVDAQDEIKDKWTQLDAMALGLCVYMASHLVP